MVEEFDYEQSEAAREATRWVEVWVANDSDVYFRALELAESGDVAEMGEYLTGALKNARKDSAAWHTARELSAADYDGRINWHEIAETLTD